ncbi:MAG: 5-formyltetrahydrofolate cyclo-ligase, partial [Acidobacteriota bacterium]
LELFHLRKMEELEPGYYGILEPRTDLTGRPARRFDIENVDMILVPGVAFDRRGGRMGHGQGFCDRLLRRARPQTPLIALAFECQLVEVVPMEEHDHYVDKVVTENTIYDGRHRRSQFTAD